MQIFKNKKIIFDRKLKEGSGNTLYGLEVCRSLDLDIDFLQRAENIRKDLKTILKSKKPIFVEVVTDSQQKIFDAFKDY